MLELSVEAVKGSERVLEVAATTTHFAEIATNASKLAAAKDLTAARASFGDVSRHVVVLLASDKQLARGRHVFECPMVSGYKKWVQPSEDLQNPYMGKRMLACGGESTWQYALANSDSADACSSIESCRMMA